MENENLTPENPRPNELSITETTTIVPVEKQYTKQVIIATAIIALVLGIAATVIFMDTTGYYINNETLNNQTQLAFDYGTFITMENIKIQLMNESINCRQIPIEYQNYTRTLIAVECLNLNNNGGK